MAKKHFYEFESIMKRIEEETKATGRNSIDINTIQKLLRDTPTIEAVPKSYMDQTRWECDIAIEQLGEIGCSFGQKMDDIKKKLEAVPVVHGWIPCSERLPECEDYAETDALLFQLQSGTIEVGYFGRNNAWRGAYFRHYRTACGVDASNVVAWMPLPDPYMEQT